ncbi:MAG: hypothetical protein BWK78_07400 [Thiotrichaceae bacterium IS1]|nr:MAG: hypothetical protein BWK78_07400 [Thiotrichaceae bacterium IS1]
MNQTKVVSFPWGPPESRFYNILKLVQRRLLSFYRDKSDLQVTLLQPPVLALAFFMVFQKLVTIGETVYFQHLRNYLTPGPGPSILIFLVVLTVIWFGISKAIVEISNTRTLYQQERLTFLKDFDYLFATFISLSLIVGLQVILFSLSFHLLFVSVPAWLHPLDSQLVGTKDAVTLWMVLMPKLFVILTALLWLTAVSAVALAMLVSIFVKTQMAAVTVMTFVMIIQLLLGGSIVKPIKDMHGAVRTTTTIMPSRWGLEGAIILFDKFLAGSNVEFSFAGTTEDYTLRKGGGDIQRFFEARQNVKPSEMTEDWLANTWSQALINGGKSLKDDADEAVAVAFGRTPQPLLPEEQEYIGELDKLTSQFQGMSSCNVTLPKEFLARPVPKRLMVEAQRQFNLKNVATSLLGKINRNDTLCPAEQELWQVVRTVDPLLRLYRQEHIWIPWLGLAILAISFFLLTWLGFTLESKL